MSTIGPVSPGTGEGRNGDLISLLSLLQSTLCDLYLEVEACLFIPMQQEVPLREQMSIWLASR